MTVDASSSAGGRGTPIASYDFDFGDGSLRSGPQADAVARHAYARPGTYSVSVRVTDSLGRVGTTTTQVVVKENLVGNAGFETGLLGWNTSGSGPGVMQSQVVGGRSGAWAAQARQRGPAAGSCVLNDSPNWVRTTLGGSYTGRPLGPHRRRRARRLRLRVTGVERDRAGRERVERGRR